ncbi:tetratricopeptide repeat protein, partial [Streptomyces sp. NPDC060131]|uniref:tetratricopeptide repeat protein n=1 Tax=Streptomyces sp. NPDC060131 TaxID=3347058 RepID=UPI003660CC08
WHLREVGHAVELDVWDWRIGDNFIERMNDAMRRATTVVALFSNNYFDPARWTREEWTSVVARRERIVPVTIEPLTASDIPDILTAVIRKDLHSLDEQAAITALLEAVNGPTGPRTAPSFPGTPAPVHAAPAGGAQGQRPRLPSGAGLPRVWNVRDRNPHFTGREALISRIREGLLGGRQAVVQALHGLGGIGKTQIALEYAHRFASQYDTVWWIDAAQADQILVRYTELAARLGIAKPEAGAEHNARTLLEHLHTQDRWLIILDNADDPHDFEGLIPTGPGHVLITSRNPGWNDRVHSLNLGVFARSDSLAYLSARMPGITPDQAGGEARRMDEDTLERRRRILGEEHPDTLDSAHSLAVTLHALGQPTDAHRMHEDTLDRRRRTLGEDHPDTLDSAHSLAVALHALGQDADARSMDEDTLDRRRRTLGENHPDTLDSAHSLAASLHNLGQYAEARRMDEYTLDGRRRILGEDHLRTLQSAYSLAVTLSALRDHATAVRLLKDTRARSRRTLGEDHQLTNDVTEALANELTAVGKRHEAQKLLSARKAGARPVSRRKRR